tara:strand:- start:65 stop:490 length:426 start_codon:yes stop_codon:yes gene_type:complete
MATPLTKPIHRTVEIDGATFIASIVPSDGDTPPSFTLRQQRYKNANSIPIANLLDSPLKDDEPLKDGYPYEIISKADHNPDKALYIDEATLKMWAKYAHAKFAEALKEYRKLTANGKTARIVWEADGSITFEPYDMGETAD